MSTGTSRERRARSQRGHAAHQLAEAGDGGPGTRGAEVATGRGRRGAPPRRRRETGWERLSSQRGSTMNGRRRASRPQICQLALPAPRIMAARSSTLDPVRGAARAGREPRPQVARRRAGRLDRAEVDDASTPALAAAAAKSRAPSSLALEVVGAPGDAVHQEVGGTAAGERRVRACAAVPGPPPPTRAPATAAAPPPANGWRNAPRTRPRPAPDGDGRRRNR